MLGRVAVASGRHRCLAQADAASLQGTREWVSTVKPLFSRRAAVRRKSRRFWNTPPDKATVLRPCCSREHPVFDQRGDTVVEAGGDALRRNAERVIADGSGDQVRAGREERLARLDGRRFNGRAVRADLPWVGELL